MHLAQLHTEDALEKHIRRPFALTEEKRTVQMLNSVTHGAATIRTETITYILYFIRKKKKKTLNVNLLPMLKTLHMALGYNK